MINTHRFLNHIPFPYKIQFKKYRLLNVYLLTLYVLSICRNKQAISFIALTPYIEFAI